MSRIFLPPQQLLQRHFVGAALRAALAYVLAAAFEALRAASAIATWLRGGGAAAESASGWRMRCRFLGLPCEGP